MKYVTTNEVLIYLKETGRDNVDKYQERILTKDIVNKFPNITPEVLDKVLDKILS